MHSLGMCHNDLKPDNIVVGADDPDKIYLIDFGLVTYFMDDNGQHIAKKNLGKFSGNFLFASIGSCCGFNKGRRDDIESMLYLLIYYLNQGKLPWCNLRSELGMAGWTFSDILWERLQQYYTKQLF
jgi:serine/threonine protein kinase